MSILTLTAFFILFMMIMSRREDMKMEISEVGIELIKQYEGLRLASYLDTGGVWTVGYGNTGEDVTEGMTITLEQAEEDLKEDVKHFSNGISDLIEVKLTQNQFDALVSFAYNVGIGAFKRSTLLKKLNQGFYQEAAEEFPRWVFDNGRRLKGLERRRFAEQQLFLTESIG